MQPGVEAQVAGAVDDGLDAHGAAVFEVLLDPRVPVEHVEQDTAVVAAVDRGAEGAQGVAAHPPAEDDFHVVWAAQVEVVHDERLEEAAGVPWCVEDDGAGDLDLAHRGDRKSTRLNSSHVAISYAVVCLKKKKSNLPFCVYIAAQLIDLF